MSKWRLLNKNNENTVINAVKPLIGRMLGYRGYKIREAE